MDTRAICRTVSAVKLSVDHLSRSYKIIGSAAPMTSGTVVGNVSGSFQERYIRSRIGE